jgi:hypothetical protein
MKSLIRWQIFGFIVTVLLGTLLHFLYDWTGKSIFVAPFSAVNESTWEHMKIFFIPSFLFALLQSSLGKDVSDDFWLVKLISITAGLLLIPILFYTYNGAFGKSPDWLNITFFVLAAASSYFVEFLLVKRGISCKFSVWYFIVLCVIAFIFVVFTFFPPKLPIFQDPITKTYGVI